MAINFYPKAGMVRAELVAVVPLSTRPPRLVLPYHHRLISHPFPGAARASWAKCDLVQSVSHERLDRITVGPTQQVVGYVGYQDLVAITHAIATYFGLDPAPFHE